MVAIALLSLGCAAKTPGDNANAFPQSITNSTALLLSFKNNCENATSTYTDVADTTITRTITNKGAYCEYTSTMVDAKGRETFDKVTVDFKLPLERCTIDEYRDKTKYPVLTCYKTTDDVCKSIDQIVVWTC